jgi:hypothetical protein
VQVPSAKAWTEAETARVEEACSRCHLLPPADALPRDAWAEAIAKMPAIPVPAGVAPLSGEELALAQAWYRRQAPEALASLPTREPDARFQAEGFTPKGKTFQELRAPAVANVNFVNLSDASRSDLLVAEMRSRGVFLLAPWAPAKQRSLRGLQREANYPAHVELADLDGNGQRDLLVGALGAMDPSNRTQGSVLAFLQDAKRAFARHELAIDLGRVCDAQAADLDGDGDRDVVAAAFGWRGPGQLTLLQCESWTPPRFTTTVLDDRDGFVRVQPADLDGDGQLELVAVLAQEHEQVLAFVREGQRWEPRVLHQAPHPGWGYAGLQVVDLDRDGDLDLLVPNGDALDDDQLKPYHGVSWFENQGQLRFVEHRVLDLFGCEAAAAGDVDGDGDLDVVAVSFLPHLDPQAWEGLDSVVWAERTDAGWTVRSLERGRCVHPTLDLADYDRDGDLDLAVGNYVWIGEGDVPTTRADFVTLFTQR